MQFRHLRSSCKLFHNDLVRNFSKRHQQQHLQKTHSEASKQELSSQYCINLVKKNDHENYLCTLLLGGQLRRYAFALRAFNVEVAKSGSNVSEEQINKMRLKFWHDSVDKCFASEKSYVDDHPVLCELKNTIDAQKLTKVYLKRLVTVRDRPRNQQFSTLKEMEEYAEQSCSSLLYLLMELCNVRNMQVDHAVSHLGKAQGIVTLLRAIPCTGRSQALNIPQETLIKHGVSQERVVRDRPNDKGVEECVFEVATAAYQHLKKAQSLIDKVPSDVRRLFLPAVAVQRYLERLRRANFRLTNQNCLRRDFMLPVALYWHSFRRIY